MRTVSNRTLAMLALGAILALGFALRAYQFEGWLHFELDQARDAKVVDEAIAGGPLDLPLLGPKAGGTFLRLGPFFYEAQYVSALIFGATPAGIAVWVMLLSVASIGLLYLFARRMFSERIAISLAFLFSVSVFMVLYGRFAWNPNPLPFFALLGFYALLRAVDVHEAHRRRYLVLAAGALGIATQLHFLAFLAFPVIAVLFLAYKRPKFSFRVWAAAAGVVFLLYLPVVLNDIETKGESVRQFLDAVTEKSESSVAHNVYTKIAKNAMEQARYMTVILTGYERGALPEPRLVDGVPRLLCDDDCDRYWHIPFAVGLVLALALLLLLISLRRREERKDRDAQVLLLLWFAVVFILYIPLASDIVPRFFLLTAPIPFLLLGVFLDELRRKVPRKLALNIGFFTVVALAASNLVFLGNRFGELSRAGTDVDLRTAADRILKERTRVTLEQQEAIVGYLEERHRENGWPVYMHSEPQHRRALKYLIERRKIPNAVFYTEANLYREGLYFLILRSRSDLEDGVRKYLVNFDEVARRPFGTLTMIEFRPKAGLDIPERQVFATEPAPSIIGTGAESGAPPRYTWRQFFARRGGSVDDEGEE